MSEMNKNAAVALLVCAVSLGCASGHMPRADEEAMLLYRECVNSAPRQLNPGPSTNALTNTTTRQSVNAVTQSERDAESEMECARIAGWEKK